MCPSPSLPPRLDINVSSTDEEVLLFLGGRKAGDPIPSNIITEINPFSIEPWDSPEGMWYLYNFEDVCSSNQRNTINTIQIGYWRFMNHLTIYGGNVAAGKKTTWEFYRGQEPLGDRTGWLMYDYQRVQKAYQGFHAAQDCNSLCRVFLQEDQRAIIDDQKPPDTEHCSPVCSDNADGENVESLVLRFLEPEERSSPTNVANQSEVGVPEQRHYRSSPDLVTNDFAENLNPFVEFSKGEYVELEDLYELESTSSSSDDSSLISGNSDECFDGEALLRDLENESNRNIKGSNKINYSDSVDGEPVLADSSPSHECSPKTSSPADKPNASTSASVSCPRGHPKRTHSGSSVGSSTSSNGSGSKSVARIAKLGKKYCCFGSF